VPTTLPDVDDCEKAAEIERAAAEIKTAARDKARRFVM
jgi:hypothetical protein